jgi:hypothetical protein
VEAGSPAERDDADGDGVLSPDRDCHAPDANRNRVAAERAEMHWLNRDAFIEAEILKAASFAFLQPFPLNRGDARFGPNLQLVEADHLRLKWRVHSCD